MGAVDSPCGPFKLDSSAGHMLGGTQAFAYLGALSLRAKPCCIIMWPFFFFFFRVLPLLVIFKGFETSSSGYSKILRLISMDKEKP